MLMKPVLFIAVIPIFWGLYSIGQNTGIGTTTPQAILDITANNSGILIPRLTTAQKNALSNPPKGLMLFDSSLNQLHIYSGSGWSNVSAAGNDFWQSQFTGAEQMVRNNTPTYRRVMVGDRPIQTSVGFSNSPNGALTVWSRVSQITDFNNYLTMDGQGIQARSQNFTMAGPQFEDNLLLNRYGGNVGIGTAPEHSKLEVAGTVGASAAMFGVGKTGISIQADNPEIGFNYFYNNGTKTMKAGYGANMGMYPNNGDVYIGTFSAYTSNADWGEINSAGYQQVITVKQTGHVGIGTTTPEAKLHVITDKPTGTAIQAIGKGVETFDFNPGAGMWRSYDHKPGLKAIAQEGGAAIEIAGPVTVTQFSNDFVYDVIPQESNAANAGYTVQLPNGIWAIMISGNNSPFVQAGWPDKKYIWVTPYFVSNETTPFILPTFTMLHYNSTRGGIWFLMNDDPIQAGKPQIRLSVMYVRQNPSAGPL